MSWSSDGRFVAGCYENKPEGLNIWNSKSGDLVGQLEDVNFVDWSPDGKYLAIRDSNQLVSILDAATLVPVTKLEPNSLEYVVKGENLPDFIQTCAGQGDKGEHLAQILLSHHRWSDHDHPAGKQERPSPRHSVSGERKLLGSPNPGTSDPVQADWPPANAWPNFRDILSMGIGFFALVIVKIVTSLISACLSPTGKPRGNFTRPLGSHFLSPQRRLPT